MGEDWTDPGNNFLIVSNSIVSIMRWSLKNVNLRFVFLNFNTRTRNEEQSIIAIEVR